MKKSEDGYIILLSYIKKIHEKRITKRYLQSFSKKYYFEKIDRISSHEKLDRLVLLNLITMGIKKIEFEELNWNHICSYMNSDYIGVVKETIDSVETINLTKKLEGELELGTPVRGNYKVRYFKLLEEFFTYLLNTECINNKVNKKIKLALKGSYLNCYNLNWSPKYASIFSNYPISSNIETMLTVKLFNGDKYTYVNFNCNTENRIFQEIVLDYIASFDENYISQMKVFVYHISWLIEMADDNQTISITELQFSKLFKKYELLMNKYKKESLFIKSIYDFNRFLIYFYRFIIDNEGKYNIRIELSNTFRKAIFLKHFRKAYEQNYIFMNFNPMDKIPDTNKIYIIHEPNHLLLANAKSTGLIKLNFTECPDQYLLDLKKYTWYSGGSIGQLGQNMHILIDFLNLLDKHNKMYFKSKKEDSKKIAKTFLWNYRMQLENKLKSESHLRNHLKSIRRYFKYYEDEYKITESDFDILSLRGLQSYKGGNPISGSDYDIIYNSFLELEAKNKYAVIYTVIFEILTLTHFRLGELMSLQRDCIVEESSDGGLIKFIKKTSAKEYEYEKVSPKILSLIKKGIKLTHEYIDKSEFSKYIFIKPNSASKTKVKRIDFEYVLRKNIRSCSELLANKEYSSNNIRDTYINTVYKEGIKKELTIFEISKITGNSYKTANMYYRDFNEIDLYVEAMSGVTISDVDINGKILKEIEKKVEKNEIGECILDICKFDFRNCLICKEFVTFPSRISNFEEAIKALNYRVSTLKNHNEIKLINCEKKLLAKYLSEMYKMEKGD